MTAKQARADLAYPHATPPDSGQTLEVAPGIHWLRMPLPFSLAHINLWLLEDGDEWVIVDTGLHDDDSRKIWLDVLAGVMREQPVNRVIATHLHPDHAGNAGWLCDKLGAELLMTREEYLLCRVLIADTGRPAPAAGLNFYRSAGFPEEATDKYQQMFGMFGRMMSPLPDAYRRLQDADRLRIGTREWEVVVGNGHSPEHACLYCVDDDLLLSGDQLLPTISSNVSVFPTEPAANPLRDWLGSIDKLHDRLDDRLLVLPAHGKPFHGARKRLAALRTGHLAGLDDLHRHCQQEQRAVDTFAALFRREIRGSELIMATGEAIAHLNWLIDAGHMTVRTDGDGIRWYRSLPRTASRNDNPSPDIRLI